MAQLIFVLLVISFFVAVILGFFAIKDQEAPIAVGCSSYVVGGLAMAALYELNKIAWVAQ